MINMQAIHYVMLICSALAAGLPQLEAAFPPPAQPYLKGVQSVLILIAGVLGAISPSSGATQHTTVTNTMTIDRPTPPKVDEPKLPG